MAPLIPQHDCGYETISTEDDVASPNLTVPEDLLFQLPVAVIAEGKTVDQLPTEALERDLAQRTLVRWKREGDARRWGMTDEQVNEIVERAIHESRMEV